MQKIHTLDFYVILPIYSLTYILKIKDCTQIGFDIEKTTSKAISNG